MTFQIGQRVRCIDPVRHLMQGGVYTIRTVYDPQDGGPRLVTLEGSDPSNWFEGRFEPVADFKDGDTVVCVSNEAWKDIRHSATPVVGETYHVVGNQIGKVIWLEGLTGAWWAHHFEAATAPVLDSLRPSTRALTEELIRCIRGQGGHLKVKQALADHGAATLAELGDAHLPSLREELQAIRTSLPKKGDWVTYNSGQDVYVGKVVEITAPYAELHLVRVGGCRYTYGDGERLFMVRLDMIEKTTEPPFMVGDVVTWCGRGVIIALHKHEAWVDFGDGCGTKPLAELAFYTPTGES